MKKKLTLGLILGASLIFAGCTQNKNNENPQSQSEAEMIKESQELANAFKSGKPMLCTMTDKENNVAQYAIKGKKMKMSGKDMSENGKIGNMINDGEWIYIWEEGATEGIKTKMMTEEEGEKLKNKMEEMKTEVPDFENPESVQEYEDQGYTINCNPENLDDSTFIPPANVNFVGFASQIEQMFSGMEQQIPDMSQFQIPEGMVVEE